MSKMKQYIDLMTPMEAYQKGCNDARNEDEEIWLDGYDKGKSFATINMPSLIEEAEKHGYAKGQEDVCTVSVSDILEKGVKQGRQEVVEWLLSEGGFPWPMDEYPERIKLWQTKLKEWGIKNDN